MDEQFRRSLLLRELRVFSQREERDLQQKLNMLDKQHRYTCKMLQQRRDSLMNEQRKVVMVKICEPKATVNIAMREIGEHKNTDVNFRGIHTSDGTGLSSRNGSEPVEPSRTVSAPPASVKPTAAPVRHRNNIRSIVSLMQMKKIATIDSISQKELARQRQKAREEAERVRQLQRDMLHKRVTDFLQSLKDKENLETFEELESH